MKSIFNRVVGIVGMVVMFVLPFISAFMVLFIAAVLHEIGVMDMFYWTGLIFLGMFIAGSVMIPLSVALGYWILSQYL